MGIEGDAPFLETAIADAAEAILKASAGVLPPITEEKKYPVKVSPAAVVSTTFALNISCFVLRLLSA